MEKIARVRRVARGPATAPLPYGTELNLSETAGFMEQNHVAGLVILKDGKIVLERYGLGFDERSRWTSFSVAKSISATLVGAAIAEGHIRSVDDAVVRYLPTLKGSAYDGVTLRHILNMTSGVRWNEDYDDPDSDVNRCHKATDTSLGSPLVTYLAKLPREAEPGSKWVYKTAETDLVGEVVMAATGKTLSAYLSEKIWAPLGMEQDAYWMLRGSNELGGCCLSIALRDYARFGLFIMNGGRIGSRQVLPQKWMEQATSATTASRLDGPGGVGFRGYGFQWWVGVDGPATYSARGIFGQSIHFNPAERLVIVTLSAWATPLDRRHREAEGLFQKAVTKAVGGGVDSE
ncbi:MAG TPA: serine hydrolase [Bryobacteraceae bacterium]|nr:serine hydrolase [Bryobacteraceae bacterium]